MVAVQEGLHLTFVASDVLPQGAIGYLRPKARELVVARDLDPAETARVLAHELAHWRLGHGRTSHPPTDVAEAEADVVSYLVCRHFGIGTTAWMDSTEPALQWDVSANARLRVSALRAKRAAETLVRHLSFSTPSLPSRSPARPDGLAG
jgi:hypothetical protein